MAKTTADLIELYLGRMNSPTASAIIKGICGEEMEFYLLIEGEKIVEVKFFSDGCSGTRACAAMAASLAEGRSVKDALKISAGQVIEALRGEIEPEHLHCAILAVSTLYKALADYFLQL